MTAGDERPDSLIATAKVFWKSYAPLWAWGMVFQMAILIFDRIGHPFVSWWLVGMPLFFWSFARASRPWLQRRVRYWHQVFWGMLIPFVVFGLAMFVIR